MSLFETKEIDLRDYQVETELRLRDAIRSGYRRILLVAPTAFGKTEMAAKLMLGAVEKGRKVWFIVDRVTLVDQTSERLAGYGIDHGVIQADHHGYAPEKLVQIISAQTLARRKLRDVPHLIFVDEAHSQYKAVIEKIALAVDAVVIGLTATPFTAGMAEHWDTIVNGTTVNDLLKRKFLTPLKIKACVTPDMKGVRKKFSGEYEDEEAGQRGITIIGDVVQTWNAQTAKHFGGPVKTIVFSPSVKHGAELCRQFAQAGFNFQQISYHDKSDAERKAKIDEFRKPDSAIDGLVSCAVLTKGFDVPDVLCGISCRPYRKSFSSHIQELGRVMRIAPGKEFGLWLDHSGNCISFADDTAWLYEYGVGNLSNAQKKDSTAREPSESIKRERFCGECGAQMVPGHDLCPECGWERPLRGEIQTVQGELIDFEHSTKKAFQPRQGLRADCLKDPRRIWNAALAHCFASSRKGPDHARKWAYGIWVGIYPGCKLPHGLFEMKHNAAQVAVAEYSLIEREVARFRKTGKRRAA